MGKNAAYFGGLPVSIRPQNDAGRGSRAVFREQWAQAYHNSLKNNVLVLISARKIP
jgi:hypothetical protein